MEASRHRRVSAPVSVPAKPLDHPPSALDPGAIELVRRALGDARRVEDVPQPCGGQLVDEGGDGAPPIVRCTSPGCGRTGQKLRPKSPEVVALHEHIKG